MQKLPTFFLPCILLITFLFKSCSPVRVLSSEETADVDFAAYHTFNFLDVSLQNDSLDRDVPAIQMLKEAITFQMEDLEYELSANPDLWVNIGVMVVEKVQTRETDIREAPVYIGQRRYHWEREEIIVDKYEHGTVTVDIIDAEEMERIWKGVAVGTLSDNPKKMERRINDAMELLFSRYPNNVDM